MSQLGQPKTNNLEGLSKIWTLDICCFAVNPIFVVILRSFHFIIHGKLKIYSENWVNLTLLNPIEPFWTILNSIDPYLTLFIPN